LQVYAPEQLDAGAVDALVDEAIAATGADSVREMGKVMGFVMGKAKGRVDGGLVQQKVRERLGD
ncbi:MAG: GatB/YqeY domain-containing protein, partial [Actinomycetota bacterium]